MKKIYFLLLFCFGFAFSGTIIPTAVYDIWYNYEYPLINNYKTQYKYYAFRLQVKAGDTMDVEIRISNYVAHDFTVDVYGYGYNPTDNQVINFDGAPMFSPAQTYHDFGDYCIYYFNVVVPSGFKYFAIHVTVPEYDYKTLFLYVDLTKYKYSNIMDFNLNTDYPFETSIFTTGYIPKDYQIYIRISSFSEDKCEVQLTTKTNAYNKRYDFKVDICKYSDKPTESQVYYGDVHRPCHNDIPNESKENMYYQFPFSTETNVNYLSIRITNNLGPLNYLSIKIYSQTGMAIAVLVVVIVLPVLVVAGIVYLLLKKCGVLK